MKKRLCFALACVLSFSILFTACQKTDESQSNSTGSASGADGATAGATGKYVEFGATPKELDGTAAKLCGLPDGEILLIVRGVDRGLAAYTTKDGAEWSAVDTTALNAYGKEHFILEMSDVIMDDGGDWWEANYSAEGECHLYQVAKSGEGREISVPALDAPGDGGFMTKYVSGMYADAGSVLLEVINGTQKEYVTLDAESGEVTGSYNPQGFPVLAGYQNGSLYLAPNGGNTIEVVSAAEGKLTATHSLPIEAGMLDSLRGVAISGDESLCYVRPTGIEKIALGGDMVQTVVDNRAFAYASPDFKIKSFLAADDNSFWVACEIQGASYVYRYYYDANAPLVAANSLYVWAMDDNALLRGAVSTFARENPEYDVQVVYGHSAEDSGKTDEDIIRELNTELLAEDGPDVLILDGLPIQSMIQQGLLADLSGTIDKSGYYENILSAYSEDGKDYAYPAAFQLPMLVMREGSTGPNISGVTDMAKLESILADPLNAYFGGYSHLFEALYPAYSQALFPGGTSVDKDALRDFLQATKAIVDGQGISGNETDPVTSQFVAAGDDGISITQISMSPSLLLYSSDNASDTKNYAADLLLNFWDFSRLELNNSTPLLEPLVGGAYIPKCIAGVPAGAQNVEGGKAFVKTLLESQDEKVAAFNGLPGYLVKKDVELNCAMDNYERMKADTGEFDVEPVNPSLVDWNAFISKYTMAANSDIILHDKVYEQAKMLYSGDIGLDEAVSNILKSTELYFAEKR